MASTFEMNSGYPNKVKLIGGTALGDGYAVKDFSSIDAKVRLGLVDYVCTSGPTAGHYFIYRSQPGQPNIFPEDNFIDVSQYGQCTAAFGLRNMLLYFTATSVIMIDVDKVQVVNELADIGIADATHTRKADNGVAWASNKHMYYFDGSKIADVTGNKISPNAGEITYNKNTRQLRVESASGTEYYTFSLKTTAWTKHTNSGANSVTFPTFVMGEPARGKKLNRVIVHGDIDATVEARNQDDSII